MATQEQHPASVTSVLGRDALLLRSFSSEERLSRSFTIDLEVISTSGAVDFQPHLGTAVSISMPDEEAVSRAFHGVLFEAALTGDDRTLGSIYRLKLRPWTELLNLGSNTRSWRDKSVKAIVEAVFNDAGFSAYDTQKLTRGLSPRDYCVQYRESDFAFVSRLLEEEGIYYFFEHGAEAHTLVLCDRPDHHAVNPDLREAQVQHEAVREHFLPRLWSWTERVTPGLNRVSLRDAHFKKPTQPLQGRAESESHGGGDKVEHYEYPGRFSYLTDEGDTAGQAYAQSRLDAGRAERRVRTGAGSVFAAAVGRRLNVVAPQAGGEILIVETRHYYANQRYASGSEQGVTIEVELSGVPSGTVWRSPMVTPKPLAGGPQTAVVVGPDNEPIYVDQHGRVRVQFPWDRKGDKDENGAKRSADDYSCWVRVSQSWADGGFGTLLIPRVGEEVIVDFLDGDLDRPIITGRVYNSGRMPPYALPAEKTKSTWKSQTVGNTGTYSETEESPASSTKGFNEIGFEDKGGSEEIFVHAQRDLKTWVRHDENRRIGRDVAMRIGRNRDIAVKKNIALTVETGDETRKISAGGRVTTINKADTLTVETGDFAVKVSAGKASIEAMQEILLKVGNNSVKISPRGVEVQGLMVKVTADTALSAQGLTSELKAGTMVTVSGALVQIN